MNSLSFIYAFIISISFHGAFFLIGNFEKNSHGAMVQFKKGRSSVAIKLSSSQKRVEKIKSKNSSFQKEQISEVSSGILKGATIKAQVTPEYPRRSILFQEEGSVTILLEIDESGSVKNAIVEKSSGHDRLDRAALEAASSAEFLPAIKDGESVASRQELTFNFKLK